MPNLRQVTLQDALSTGMSLVAQALGFSSLGLLSLIKKPRLVHRHRVSEFAFEAVSTTVAERSSRFDQICRLHAIRLSSGGARFSQLIGREGAIVLQPGDRELETVPIGRFDHPDPAPTKTIRSVVSGSYER